MIHKTRAYLVWLSRHTLVRYVIVGGTTFVIDFGLLVSLHGGLGVNLVIATTLAYWVSITFNFFTNRYWAFQQTEASQLMRHLSAYALLLGGNYLYTVLFIAGAVHFGMNYAIAKVIAVLMQTSWTYVLYKKFVFI